MRLVRSQPFVGRFEGLVDDAVLMQPFLAVFRVASNKELVGMFGGVAVAN